jgi:CBS domain-containing protein
MEARPVLSEPNDQTKKAGVETVGSILRFKGDQVWSIGPEATVYNAIALMAEKRVGSLMVLSELDIVGIVSERDYARKVILQGRSSRDTPVCAIMTCPVITVAPERTVAECLRIMTINRIRYLPVMEGSTLLGLVSIGDLVSSILAMQAFTIDQLETYIAGSYPK